MSEAIDDTGGMTAAEYEADYDAWCTARDAARDQRAKAFAVGLTAMRSEALERVTHSLRRLSEDARTRLTFDLTAHAREVYSAMAEASDLVVDFVEAHVTSARDRVGVADAGAPKHDRACHRHPDLRDRR